MRKYYFSLDPSPTSDVQHNDTKRHNIIPVSCIFISCKTPRGPVHFTTNHPAKDDGEDDGEKREEDGSNITPCSSSIQCSMVFTSRPSLTCAPEELRGKRDSTTCQILKVKSGNPGFIMLAAFANFCHNHLDIGFLVS